MRLCYSTWSMQKPSVDDLVANLADIGYDSIELTVIPGWSTELDTLDRAERQRIRALLDRHGLALPAVAGHRPLLATDPGLHAENWRRLIGAIDLCVDWAGPDGPPILDTTAGAGHDRKWDDVRDLLIERLIRLCDYASERGVTIGIEPHVSDLLETPERTRELLDLVDRPNLKVTFDISHFNVQGIPIEHSVELMAPVTCFTHIKDESGRVPDFQFLIPGEGEFDYVRYLRAMHRAGWTGDIGIEISLMVQRRPSYDPWAAARQSYAVVSRAFEVAGVPRGARR
ncbi:MAG: sugar phosphate isomerase/epimerase family protein [Chloroflexota bacterium]